MRSALTQPLRVKQRNRAPSPIECQEHFVSLGSFTMKTFQRKALFARENNQN